MTIEKNEQRNCWKIRIFWNEVFGNEVVADKDGIDFWLKEEFVSELIEKLKETKECESCKVETLTDPRD